MTVFSPWVRAIKKIPLHASRLKRETAGGIAVIVSLSFLGVALCIGSAIDYVQMTQVKAKLQGAADAAALAAAANPTYKDVDVLRVADGYLKSNEAAVRATNLAASVTHSNSAGGGSAISVKVTAQVPTTFLRLGGINYVDVKVASVAASGTKAAEIYVALDLSESMNIAADPVQRAALVQATKAVAPGGCEFACHFPDGSIAGGAVGYDIARAAGVKLRVDNLIEAFQGFVDNVFSATSATGSKVSAKIAVVGFSDDATLLSPATDNLDDLKNAPATFPVKKSLNTHFEKVLPSIRTMMGAQGDGSAGTPVKTLVLITDGVNWDRYDGTGGETIDPTLCDAFKNDGINVVVVDIKYQDASGEYWFDLYVKPFLSDVSPALTKCASPGMYSEATDSDLASLNAGFSQVLKSLQQKVVLTQ